MNDVSNHAGNQIIFLPDIGVFASLVIGSGSIAAATNSDRSRTRMVSSSEHALTGSSSIVMQKGHPTATVSELVRVS